MKHLNGVDEKLNACFSVFSRSREKAVLFKNAGLLGCSARVNSDSFTQVVRAV